MAAKDNQKKRASKNLKRSDIAKTVHEEIGLSLEESTMLMNQMFGHISGALSQGKNVKLAGFGTFNVRQKTARIGRNPKTGKECMIPARKVLTFKPSDFMKERVQHSVTTENEIVKCEAHSGKLSSIEPKATSPVLPLTRENWIGLFEILGIIAFASGEATSQKIDAVIESVIELKALLEPKASISRRTISSWLTLNKSRLISLAEKRVAQPRFESRLVQLREIKQKPDIIFSMLRIAISDETYDESERSLITYAIIHWDMTAKMVEDIEEKYPTIASDIRESLAKRSTVCRSLIS